MAVGIIIGGAFGLMIKSFVDNIMMPLVAGVFKLPDFSTLFRTLDGKTYESIEKAREAGASVIAYGSFMNDFINLIIIAFSLFLIVKYVANAVKKKEEAEPEKPDPQIELLTEIRDSLKK